jgi:hypothetical protein
MTEPPARRVVKLRHGWHGLEHPTERSADAVDAEQRRWWPLRKAKDGSAGYPPTRHTLSMLVPPG